MHRYNFLIFKENINYTMSYNQHNMQNDTENTYIIFDAVVTRVDLNMIPIIKILATIFYSS